MSKKKPPLDLADENAERSKYAGLTQEEIAKAASAIRTQKQKSAEVSGTLSGKLDVFEKAGGHKAALKVAERVTGMEPDECADWMRAFQAYFDALGGNDQLDMFEQMNEQDANAASIDAASKATAATPSAGAEPGATVQ